jgi:hypothetical protein
VRSESWTSATYRCSNLNAIRAFVPAFRFTLSLLLCRQRLRRWFAITAPMSLIASFVLSIADRIHAIDRSFPRTGIQYHHAGQAQAGRLRMGSFFASWLLGCSILAAVATVVNGFDPGDSESAWQSESHLRARERLGSIFLVALFTSSAFLVGMAAALFIISAIVGVVGWAHFARFNLLAAVPGYVVIAGIVSWSGMAIPLIVSGKLAAWAALKRSVKLSNGTRSFFFCWLSSPSSVLTWHGMQFAAGPRSRSPPLSHIPCGIDGCFAWFRFWRPRQRDRQCPWLLSSCG